MYTELDMAEIECPICREQVIFPQGEPNVFECPECVAELDWNGKHITGVMTNRKYLFVDGENFASRFDPETFADAIDFANEVMDNNITVLSSFGHGGNSIVTEDSIIDSMNFDRSFSTFGIVFFVISLMGFILLLSTGAELAMCMCMVPSIFVLSIASVGGSTHTSEDLVISQSAGGSYGQGRGIGFVPDSSYYTGYVWKNKTFTFNSFKSVNENHYVELRHFSYSGGDNSHPEQGFMYKMKNGDVAIGSYGVDKIYTSVHNLEREGLVGDFEQILEIRNQLKKKIGTYLPIKINFDSVLRPQKIMKIIENDSELSKLWKKLEEGK